MIGKTLQSILDEKGMNVNELAKIINVSNQTLYSIIKRDNMKIDFDILLKICSALNVNVERFYNDYISPCTDFSLTEHEKTLVIAYRNKPHMQSSVNKLLDIDGNANNIVSDMINVTKGVIESQTIKQK